jgi:hypothetical protein
MTAEPRWILDGAPYYADELVYAAADTVIFLDYPKPVVMWRVLWRTLRIEPSRRPEVRTGRRGSRSGATLGIPSGGRGSSTRTGTGKAWR